MSIIKLTKDLINKTSVVYRPKAQITSSSISGVTGLNTVSTLGTERIKKLDSDNQVIFKEAESNSLTSDPTNIVGSTESEMSALSLDDKQNIFQKIDKNTKNVVTPKIQIDQLINQIPTSNQNYQSQISLDLNNLDFLMNIGEKYIQSAELNLVDNIARIDIKNMPESQYMILKNVSSNFNVIIASDNTQASNGLVNGDILLNLEK